jgi:hypothetical protein
MKTSKKIFAVIRTDFSRFEVGICGIFSELSSAVQYKNSIIREEFNIEPEFPDSELDTEIEPSEITFNIETHYLQQ